MNAHNILESGVDPEGKWLYRVGGIAAIVLVVGYILSFPIYFSVGDPPASGVEAQLAYFAEHAAGWWAIILLMVSTTCCGTDLLRAYLALKHVNRGSAGGARLQALLP
jgi:hypothetical protein